MKYLIVLVLLAVAVAGCTETPKTQNMINKTASTTSFLKEVLIEEIGENNTRITAVYEFPDSSYSTALKDVRVNNSMAILFVEVNRTGIGFEVITTRNVTVVVNGSINTALVITSMDRGD